MYPRQLPQGWNPVQLREVIYPMRRRQHMYPWRQDIQLIQGFATLAGQGASPDIELGIGNGVEAGNETCRTMVQALQAVVYYDQRGWRRLAGGFQIFFELDQFGERSAAGRIAQDFISVADAGKYHGAEYRRVEQTRQAGPQGHQMAGKIAAIHR